MGDDKKTEDAPAPALVDRLIFRDDMADALGVGKEALRRWIRDGRLPKPDVAITRRTTAWRLSTLRAAGIGMV